MNKPKRVAAVLGGVLLLWLGLCLVGQQNPWASQRPLGDEGHTWRAEAQPPAGSEEIFSRVVEPTTILYVAPYGKAVKKGDLLIELDVAALTDQRIEQVVDVRKTQSELVLAKDSVEMEKHAAEGQVKLAEMALRLAQMQLKAFMEGEHPRELALAQGTAALADQKRRMLEDRYERLRHATDIQKDDDDAKDALQEAELALQEARMQSFLAADSLATLKGIGHDSRVADLELTLAQKEFELARAKDTLASATLRGSENVSLAEENFEREKHRLALLDDQITKCKIYAPRDGTVLYPQDSEVIRPGAVVRERQVLVHLLPTVQSKP